VELAKKKIKFYSLFAFHMTPFVISIAAFEKHRWLDIRRHSYKITAEANKIMKARITTVTKDLEKYLQKKV